MKVAARTALAVVVLLAGIFFLPRPASRVVVPDATAQIPSPTIPDIFPKESPSPSQDPDKDDKDDKDDDKKGGRGDKGGRGGPDKNDDDNGKKDGKRGDKKKDDKKKNDKKKNRKKNRKKDKLSGVYVPGKRSFTSDKLVSVAAQLRSLGWTSEEIIRRVYPPFIIAGEAAWINTWGAPRYGPGPIVRTHEGQDVFCEYGSPVLASERGVIEFDDGGLGGLVARLYTPAGRYWYYAHLSDWNTRDFATGDEVAAGDVIGYCGNTGNALTTPPHVHFGWYKAGGADPQNPQKTLVGWLRSAEDNVVGLVAEVLGKRVKQKVAITAQRRFGDEYTPDRSELGIAGESLWASGSYPATGALGLAQSALQAALSTDFIAFDAAGETFVAGSEEPEPETAPSPSKTLAQILEGMQRSAVEVAD